jgi:hypothetical protein
MAKPGARPDHDAAPGKVPGDILNLERKTYAVENFENN